MQVITPRALVNKRIRRFMAVNTYLFRFCVSATCALFTAPNRFLPHNIPTQTHPTDPRSAFAVARLELVLDTVGLIALGALVRLWEILGSHLSDSGC
jgi:hypothetical protein